MSLLPLIINYLFIHLFIFNPFADLSVLESFSTYLQTTDGIWKIIGTLLTEFFYASKASTLCCSLTTRTSRFSTMLASANEWLIKPASSADV